MSNYNELILPQQIKGFTYVESDFDNSEQSFDCFSLVLAFQTIDFLPIVDTDEIEIRIRKNDDTSIEYISNQDWNEYIGKEIKTFWKCINSQGYFDLFIFSIDSLTPTFSILSEGSSIKVIAR
ncbi:MAG: DUF6334 family protein [Bacteroidota bacterium]